MTWIILLLLAIVGALVTIDRQLHRMAELQERQIRLLGQLEERLRDGNESSRMTAMRVDRIADAQAPLPPR